MEHIIRETSTIQREFGLRSFRPMNADELLKKEQKSLKALDFDGYNLARTRLNEFHAIDGYSEYREVRYTVIKGKHMVVCTKR